MRLKEFIFKKIKECFGRIKEYIRRNWREWAEAIVTALILALVIRTFALQAFKIPTGSMEKTLFPGDRILVNKLKYGPQIPWTHFRLPGYGKLERGDVIVFKYPEDPQKDFIKRLIALPGETVIIREGAIYINGVKIEDRKILNQYYYNHGEYGVKGQAVLVPQGYYFVLGDNSANSKDSRFWGFVPEYDLIGKAEVIYWPPNRIRMIQ